MNEHDVAVIGLGGIGSSVAYWSAARGARVVGFEQFALGHDRGSSHDHSRIIRYSYHSPIYVELAKLAYKTWADIENASGEQLILRCGGLDLFPADCAIAPDDYRASLDSTGIAYEWLDSDAIRERWPQFLVDDDVCGLFQAEGGIAAAARGVAAHQLLARAEGADLREHCRVDSVREVEGEVELIVDGIAHRCGAAVIAADAWTNRLLDEPLPLTVLREQVTYYESPVSKQFDPTAFPVWIWMDEPSFYGFPTFGEGALKVAQDCGGHVTSADERSFDPDVDEFARVDRFSRSLFGDAVGDHRVTKTCLYTLTPDRDFVLDRVPGTHHIWVVQGAAHAYKFVSALGALLADCALDGSCESTFDRSPFAFDRPALTDPGYAPNWMV